MANMYQENMSMDAELRRLLQQASHDQLVQIVQQLIMRYPALLSDIAQWLTRQHIAEQDGMDEEAVAIDEEVTEDWDFSGDELDSYPLARLVLPPLAAQTYQERLAAYSVRLECGEAVAMVRRDLLDVLWEVELRAEQHDYHGALSLYALLLNAYLAVQRPDLNALFEYALNETMSTLETLLAEASSTLQVDASKQLSPLMNQDDRQHWLERIFALWLKYLEERRPVERITELLHMVAWREDLPMLQSLVLSKMPSQDDELCGTIVDFARLYRVRMLAPLLKSLI